MIQKKESKNARRGSLLSSVFFVFLFFVCGAGVSPTHAAQDSYDSLYVSTLNMTDEEIKSTYGTKEDSIEVKPTMQELHEDSPQYEKRVYNHKQQVIVGSMVMLCVAIAMVMMNNYNPTR